MSQASSQSQSSSVGGSIGSDSSLSWTTVAILAVVTLGLFWWFKRKK